MESRINSKIGLLNRVKPRDLIKDIKFRRQENKTAMLPKKGIGIPVSRLAPSRLEDLYLPHNLTKQVLEFIWPEIPGSSLQPERYMDAMLKLTERAPEFLKDQQLKPLGQLLVEERAMQMLLYGYRNQVVMV